MSFETYRPVQLLWVWKSLCTQSLVVSSKYWEVPVISTKVSGYSPICIYFDDNNILTYAIIQQFRGLISIIEIARVKNRFVAEPFVISMVDFSFWIFINKYDGQKLEVGLWIIYEEFRNFCTLIIMPLLLFE